MPKWVNHDKAVEFLNGIQDPIVRHLILKAYSNIYTEDILPECDLDVLFLYRLIESLLRNRVELAEVLLGKLELFDAFGQPLEMPPKAIEDQKPGQL